MALDCLSIIKDNHGRIQAFLYFASAILGFFIAVPVGISLRHFQGTCFLFAQIVWDNSMIWPWSETSCDFLIFFNMGMTIAYSLAMGLFTMCVVWPKHQRHYKLIGNLEQHNVKYILQGMNPVFMVINAIIALVVLCAAGTITGGFIRTCEWTVEAMMEMDYLKERLPDGNLYTPDFRCIDAQRKIDWANMKIVRGTSRGVNGTQFFNCFIIATIAAWILTLVWVIQLIFNVLAGCMVCSCEVAEEKRKPDKSWLVAQRRSRMATPSGTPGGQMSNVPLGQSMPPVHQVPPPRPLGFEGYMGEPPRGTMGSQSSYGAPPFPEKPPLQEKPPMRGQQIALQPLQPKTPTQSYA